MSPTRSVADERGLANCPAIRPTLRPGTPEAVGEHDGHLQDDFQLVADRVGREVVEGLCAVTGLEEKHLTAGGDEHRDSAMRRAGLAGEHEWRERQRAV